MYESGLTQEELKTELAKDEKLYTEQEQEEIFLAITKPEGEYGNGTNAGGEGDQSSPNTGIDQNNANAAGTQATANPSVVQPTIAPAIAPEVPNAIVVDQSNPNAVLDLNQFDYDNLVDKNFAKYESFVSQLAHEKQFDFVEMRVNPVIKAKWEGLPGSPMDFKGIEITSNVPVKTTRVPVKHILDLNAQVRNTKKYFLLKK
jgi:hypothetical protein